MKSKRALLIIGVTLAASACGKVGDLEPRSGNSLPPKAYGQSIEQTAEVLTTPSVQARPGRTDELLKRSERREDDPFDVAPGEEPKPLTPQATTTLPKPDPK
jgi:hypothetical protein